MTYGDFKQQCKESEHGRYIFGLWMAGKLPLTWAMALFLIYDAAPVKQPALF